MRWSKCVPKHNCSKLWLGELEACRQGWGNEGKGKDTACTQSESKPLAGAFQVQRYSRIESYRQRQQQLLRRESRHGGGCGSRDSKRLGLPHLDQ